MLFMFISNIWLYIIKFISNIRMAYVVAAVVLITSVALALVFAFVSWFLACVVYVLECHAHDGSHVHPCLQGQLVLDHVLKCD